MATSSTQYPTNQQLAFKNYIPKKGGGGGGALLDLALDRLDRQGKIGEAEVKDKLISDCIFLQVVLFSVHNRN